MTNFEVDDESREHLLGILTELKDILRADAVENQTPYLFNRQRAMLGQLLDVFEWKYHGEHTGPVKCPCGNTVAVYADVDAEYETFPCSCGREYRWRHTRTIVEVKGGPDEPGNPL